MRGIGCAKGMTALPDEVVLVLSRRDYRRAHLLWHGSRDRWLRLNSERRTQFVLSLANLVVRPLKRPRST